MGEADNVQVQEKHGCLSLETPLNRRRWLAQCALAVTAPGLQLATQRALAVANPSTPVDAVPATQFLPLFPLGVVAFPGELVLLHIFEPRYKQLITESAEHGIHFGIVTIVPGGVSSIGTEMQLEHILRTDDSGNMDVATRGIRAFRLASVQRVVDGRLYSGGQVSFNTNDTRTEPAVQNALVQRYNQLDGRSEPQQIIRAPYPQNLSFLIGHDVGLSQAQELQLLTIPVEHDRQVYLLQHLGSGS